MRIYLFLIGAMILVSSLAVAHETGASASVDSQILDAKKDVMAASVNKLLIRTSAVIEVANNNSLDASELTSLRDDIAAEQDYIANATDKEELNDIRGTIKDLVENFRNTAKKIGIGAYREEAE